MRATTSLTPLLSTLLAHCQDQSVLTLLARLYMKKRGAEPNDKIVGISNSIFLSEDEARKLPRRAQKKTGMPQSQLSLSFHLTLAKI